MDLRVYNSAGELVAQVAQGLGIYAQPTGLSAAGTGFVPDQGGRGLFQVAGPDLTLAWDGTNTGGQYVAGGTYTAVLTSRDPFGKVTTFTSQVAVIRQPSTLQVDIYNSAGELVRHFEAARKDPGAGNELALSSPSFVPPPGAGPGLTIRFGDGSGDTLSWDGRNDQGGLVQSGSYEVRVFGQEAGGQSLMTDTVTVVDAGESPLAAVVAAPNPAGADGGPVELLLSAPAVYPVEARVYDEAGELVAAFSAPGGSSRLSWNPREGDAPGVYLVVLQTREAGGNLAGRTLKVALVR